MGSYFNLLGVKIAITNLELAFETIEQWIKNQVRTYVCIAPASTIVDCQKNEEYRSIVNSAGMATPDGMPLVWLGRMKGNKNIRRTYGPDLLPTVCEKGQQRGYKHYFFGGSDETLDLLRTNLRSKYPGVNIVGVFSPDLRDIGEIESQDVIDQINQANPDILWVGLGSPKQDYWMFNHRDKLNVPVMVGVGAAFDFVAGTKKQAPRWMQRSGLEWFFRLCSEPKRLWRRYLVGNTQFVFYLMRSPFVKKVQV